MKERPILFSGPMVRAILDGRKTQTRRVMNPQPAGAVDLADYHKVRPYGIAGDRLWVRETFCTPDADDYVIYRADWSETDALNSDAMRRRYPELAAEFPNGRWRPSIHMPRKYCRLVLEVKAVRVERLQDLSRDDAIAEGCPMPSQREGMHPWPEDQFEKLWDSLNEKRGYGRDMNPWVWVIKFQSVEDQGNE